MSQKRQARRAGRDRSQALAKLHALERLHLAGLIDDRSYAARLARLQAQLDAAEAVQRLASWAEAQSSAAVVPHAVPPPAPVLPVRRHRPVRRGAPVAIAAAFAVLVAGSVGAIVVTRARSHGVTPRAAATAAPARTAAPTVAAGTTLAALRAAAPLAGGAVIDAAHADALVRAFWPAREEAVAAHDRAAVAALETGPAAEADTVGCTARCAAFARPLVELRLFVPRDHSFPAAFLAEALTTTTAGDTSAVERMVFTRASGAGLWSLALISIESGAEHLGDAPQTDAAGFDVAAPSLPDSPEPATLPAALAAYYQHWAQHGAAPSGTAFAPGPWTDAVGGQLWQRVAADARAGAVDTVGYDADPSRDGVWSFATSVLDSNGLPRSGWSITCATVRYQRVSVAAGRGQPLVQPADRSRFGPLLVPGSYLNVTVAGVQQACIEEQPRFTSLVVAGSAPQDTSVVGAPSSGG